METRLEGRLGRLEDAQRQLARARRHLARQTLKEEQILREAFVLYVIQGCCVQASALYAQKYTSMTFAAVADYLQRRFLQTPIDELSNIGFESGVFTPPVSQRCARFYEGYRIAARVKRLNDDVGIAPSWDSVSGDLNQGEKRRAGVLYRSKTESEKHKKRWARWRKKWSCRVSKVMTQLGGNVERVTAKVGPDPGRETRFWSCLWSKKVARNLGPKTAPLRLDVK